MSTFAKIMVVVNFVLAFAFLAAAGTLHGAAESWKDKHTGDTKRLNDDINNLQAQLKAKQNDLDVARSEAGTARTEAEAAKASLKLMNDSNAALMRELETKNGQIAKLEAAITDTAGAVKDQTARNEALSNQLAQADAERKQTIEKLRTSDENLAREAARADSAEKAVAAHEASIKKMTYEMVAMNTTIVAYQKTYGALSDKIAVQAVRGVIQNLSAKDDVFVLSVGSKDGVKVGYEFTVSRGDHYVTTLVVDSVYPNHAAAHTKPGMKKLDPQAGDAVATATGL